MPKRIRESASDQRRHQRVILGTALLGLAVCVSNFPRMAQANMTIRSHDAKRHDRFYAGVDKEFIGQPFDWSGVGKTADGNWVTMVSPSYFVSAAHLAPDTAEQVTFFEANNGSTDHAYTIAAGGQRISMGGSPTDLWLGKLTTPLDPGDNIDYYPILALDSEASYLGMVLFNYGKSDRVGRNVLDGIQNKTVDGISGRSMLFDYDNNDVTSVGGDETFLQGGDSGGPSFVNWNGELALLGVHWFKDDAAALKYSGDTFIPHYLAAMNSSMSGETLTLVPEPSTFAIWSVLTLVGAGFGWRRKRNR